MKSIFALVLSIVLFVFGLIIATGAWTEPLPLSAPEAEAPEPVAEEAAVKLSLGVEVAPALEPLTEDVPREWIPQGPGPVLNGQVENIPGGNPVIGAVHAVTPHPSDANILYLGAVNGGVWRTTNALSLTPNWVPLTDRFPSLSISSLEFDPTDANNLTLVAGIGRFSNFARRGGPRTGLLRTADGGSTWTQLGAVDLAGRNISAVAPRGATILVAVSGGTNIGIYRSTDTGANFTRISNDGTSGLPAGTAFDLFGDPTNTANLYAAIGGLVNGGVWFSNDTGATWTDVTDTTNIRTGGVVDGGESNMELAVSAAGTGFVYLAVCNLSPPAPNRQRLVGVFQAPLSVVGGAGTWTSYGVPAPTIHPGGQCGSNLSITADPATAAIVYVGGDRQAFPNGIGATDFTGNLWRATAANTWLPITHDGTSSNSAPHADSRDMAFDVQGDIIQGDDGGIYAQTDPTTGNGDWFPVIGDLQVTEFHDVAYDTNSDIIIGGAQDTGTPQQQTPDGATWDSVQVADGGDVAIDNITLAGVNQSIRYSSTQFLGSPGNSSFIRETYDQNNVQQGGTVSVGLTTDSGTILVPGSPTIGGNCQFKTPIELNAIDPRRLIIGAQSTYESFNQGDNVDEIFRPGNLSIQINRPGAVAYGGKREGVPNEDVLYVGSGNQVFVRTTAVGNLTATAALPGAGNITDIVLDPDDWMTAYVTATTRVFSTNDAGANWTDITGNLLGVANLRTIVFVPGSIPVIFVGGESGVFEMRTNLPGAWGEAGAFLPEAPVYELQYVATFDILLAGTLGRGAWILPDVSIAPQIQVPSNIAFGDVCTPNTATETLDVCNTGNADLLVEKITSSDTQFAVTIPSGNYPVTISPDFCFPFEVTFTPTPSGATSATLTIPSNDPAQPIVEVAVTGDAGETDINVAIANSGDFGEVCTGAFADLNLSLLNQGNCDLSISNISADDPRFVLPDSTTFPLVLSPDADFNLPIRFEPDACGSDLITGTITVNSDDPDENPLSIAVSGSSPCPDIQVAIANSGDFGDVCKTDFSDLDLTLFNQGKCALEISDIALGGSDSSWFDLPEELQTPLVLSPDAEFRFPVRFSPDECSDATRTAQVVITSDDPDEMTVNVNVSGTAPCPNLVIDPMDMEGLYAFPTTVVDSTGTLGCFSERSATLRNNSVCPLTISNITTQAETDYAVMQPTQFPILLPSGEETLEVIVRFRPQSDTDPLAPSEVTDVLVVTSDDPDSTHEANLCGESAQQSGVRILVTDVSSGSPVIVGEVDSITIQSKGKNRPGPINLRFTDQPVSSAPDICGNAIQYHVNQETLPSTATTGSNPKSSYEVKAREGNLQAVESFGLGQCEFRDFQLELQDSDSEVCLLLPKGAPCTNDGECCSGRCKGPEGGKTCK